jgi:uncharacterized OB-fold protein
MTDRAEAIQLGVYGPRPSAVSAGFWDALREGRVDIQRCQRCRRWQHPPLEECAACGGAPSFETVNGTGRVYSRTSTAKVEVPFVTGAYTVAVIELDEQEHLRLIARLQEGAGASPAIGDRVRLVAARLLDGPHAAPVYCAADDDRDAMG